MTCPSCGHDGLPPLVCEHCGHRWYATPAPLDEGRLARVMRGMCDCIRSDEDAAVWARDIATGYAVLQRIEAPDEGNEWQERNE